MDADSATPVLLPEDCAADPGAFSDLTVEGTAVPMVLRVSWSTDRPGAGTLAWAGAGGEVGASPPGPVGTEHSALVVGVPADTPVTLLPRLDDGTEPLCGAPEAARTGPLPPSAPALSLSPDHTDATLLDDGYVVVPVISFEGTWLTVLDGAARPVWMVEVRGLLPRDSAPAFRVLPDREGRGLWFNTQGGATWEDGEVLLVGWAGEVLERVAVRGGHTDFALLPDGGVAVLGWTIRELDGRRILGDTVVRVEPDGSQAVLWDAFDHFSPELTFTYPKGFLPNEPDVEDWSHANGVSYDEVEDDLLVSVPGAFSVTRIDARTGAVAWTLGPPWDDLDYEGDVLPVDQPHSVSAVDGGLLLFNRRDWVRGEDCSEAVELSVDLERGRVSPVWTYGGERCEHLGFLGGAERLESGGTLVSWSLLAMLDVARPDRTTAWRALAPLGFGYGFATWTASVGPTAAP